MSFLELAKRRYSTRSFNGVKVEEEKLREILEAGRVAPTAKNNQPQVLIVVREEKNLEKLAKATPCLFGSTCAIIVCGDRNKARRRPEDGHSSKDIDTSIVTDHMMLAATDLGVNNVWVCNFKLDVLKEEFNLPDHIEPISILVLGYSDKEEKPSDRHDQTRKPLEETVFFEEYKEEISFGNNKVK